MHDNAHVNKDLETNELKGPWEITAYVVKEFMKDKYFCYVAEP